MKMLFKLGIILAIVLKSTLGFADNNADKIYDTFEGKKGVFSLSFSKSVLEPFEIFLDDDTKKVIYKMKKIKFMVYDEDKGDLFADDVYDRIVNAMDSGAYFEIDPDEIECDDCNFEVDNNDEIMLIGHGNKRDMDEFHIVVNEDETCVLFSFFGDITVEDIREFGNFSNSTKEWVSF